MCTCIHVQSIAVCVSLSVVFLSAVFLKIHSTEERKEGSVSPPQLLAWHTLPWAIEWRRRLRSSLCCIPLQVMIDSYAFYFFCFLGPHLWHIEVPRLGGKSELQLPATATQNLNLVSTLNHSSQQHQILNPLSEARDRTCNLMVPSWIHFCSTVKGTPGKNF